MRIAWLLAFGVALGVAACAQTATPGFGAATLQPTPENEDDGTLTGWLHLGDHMRLYSSLDAFRLGGSADCVAVKPLSMAGNPTPDFEARRMSVTGRIERGGDTCASGMTIVASDISAP